MFINYGSNGCSQQKVKHNKIEYRKRKQNFEENYLIGVFVLKLAAKLLSRSRKPQFKKPI